MYERTALLCYMLGWMEQQRHPIKRTDSLILLDQILNKMNQPRVTETEHEELKMIDHEIGIFFIQMGVNTKRQKQIAEDGHL